MFPTLFCLSLSLFSPPLFNETKEKTKEKQGTKSVYKTNKKSDNEKRKIRRRKKEKNVNFFSSNFYHHHQSSSRPLRRAQYLLEDLVLVDDGQDAVRLGLGDARQHVPLLDGPLVEHAGGLVDGSGDLE